MIWGSECWSRMCQFGMGERLVDGESHYTFENAPETIYDLLRTSAEAAPESVSIVDDGGERYTFAELLDLADAMAGYLAHTFNVGAGSRVGLLLDASIEFCATYFACSKIGAIAVPFSTKYRARELTPLVAHADLSVLLLDEAYRGRLSSDMEPPCPFVVCDREHRVPRTRARRAMVFGYPEALRADRAVERAGDLSADAVMMYTSGTTSASKAVLLTNLNVIHAALVYQRLMGTTGLDRTVIPVPIYHITGLVALLTQFVYARATVYLHRRFDARRLLTCVRDESITYLHASPTAFEKVLALRDEFPKLPSLRAILSGSSYEPVHKMRQFHEWLPACAFQVVYGLTETSSPALLFPYDSPTSIYAGATGKPVPGVGVRIVDDEGRDVRLGTVGEILLRGTCITRGYFRCSAEALDADGWLPTGDMGYANAEGMVWVVDRKKDMINRGGEKIWCCSLEEALTGLPGVLEACVAGIPDELYGEVAVAAVVPEPGADLTEEGVIEAVREHVASFEVPQHVLIVDSIPQTAGDKPNRAAVCAAVLDRKGRD